MSSTRTLSGPWARASRSAASLSALRVASFFFSRRPGCPVVTAPASHIKVRARKLACAHFYALPSARYPPPEEERNVRGNGMTYNTGFIRHGKISQESFDPVTVRRELAIIRDDLHCNAVQVIGGDPERLELAARYAAELGLEVWFSPYPLELAPADILALFADCAERAERLRKSGAEVVFVAGVELSIMNPGFMPGDSTGERLGLLLGDAGQRAQKLAGVRARVNEFLGEAVALIRERFAGRVTYAAIPFEVADWALFDIVAVE